MMRAGLFGALVLGVALTSTHAYAQRMSGATPANPSEDAIAVRLAEDATLFSGNALGVPDTTVLASAVSGEVDLDAAVLRLAVPLAFEARASQAELGNVELEALGSVNVGDRAHRLLIGAGVALPTGTDTASPCTDFVLCPGRGYAVRSLAWAASFRNGPAWAEQALTVWPSLEYRFAAPWVFVTFVASAPIFFPMSGVGGPYPLTRGRVELMLSIDASAGIRFGEILDVGLAWLGWVIPSALHVPVFPGASAFYDVAQTALALSIRSDDALRSPVGGGIEMIFDLDDPWGPTGASGRLWGARMFVHGRFELAR